MTAVALTPEQIGCEDKALQLVICSNNIPVFSKKNWQSIVNLIIR